MAKTIHLFKEMEIPLDLATETVALLGRKRSGKTFCGGVMAEEFFRLQVQFVVLDTIGKWFGLRMPGTGPGLDVIILGGLHGDVPLAADSGALVADLVMDSGRSFVVDLSQFSLADRKRFAYAFGNRLWSRKKGEVEPAPVHVFLEECQLIIPQFVGRDDAKMVGIWEEIVRLGGNYGIGITMISQRPQSVNKEVLTQTEVLMCFQLNGTPERKQLKEWITQHGADVNLLDELPGLEKGEAYVWSPQFLRLFKKMHVLQKHTFDASATPKVGERKQAPVGQMRPVNLEKLKQEMEKISAQVAADDPKFLRRRVAELEHQLQAQQGSRIKVTNPETVTKVIEKVKTKTVTIPLIRAIDVARLEQLVNRMDKAQHAAGERTQEAAERFLQVLDASRVTIAKAKELIDRALKPDIPPLLSVPPAQMAATVSRYRAHPVRRTTIVDGEAPPPGQAAMGMLRTIAQLRRPVSRKDLAMMTGYADPTGGGFRNRLYELTGNRLAVAVGNAVELTEEGRVALGGAVGPPPTATEIAQMWSEKLDPTARKMFEWVLEVGQTTRAQMAAHFGYSDPTGGGFRNRLYELTGPGIIEAEGGDVRPAPLLVHGPLAA